jgi:mannose-6-phosphate isomerase-like protein (cupin superfamily)
MKFTLKNAKEFGWGGLKGWAYNSKDDFAHASAAIFKVTGSHGKVKSTKSDRVYLVLEGKGQFVVGDEKTDVEKDDVIIIPKNTPYDYKTVGGKLKLFLVHTPAYDEKTEVKLDN